MTTAVTRFQRSTVDGACSPHSDTWLAWRTLPGRYSLGRYADPWPWHPRLLQWMAAYTGQHGTIHARARARDCTRMDRVA
jgi:hypothetical protein